MKTKSIYVAFCILVVIKTIGQVNEYTNLNWNAPTSMYVPQNYDQTRQMYEAQAQQQQQMLLQLKASTEQCTMQAKTLYNNATKFPQTISDGEHKVIVSDNNLFCGNRKVYVENNKITKYYNDYGQQLTITFSSSINNAKAMLNVILKDKQGNNVQESGYMDVYFIEDIYK